MIADNHSAFGVYSISLYNNHIIIGARAATFQRFNRKGCQNDVESILRSFDNEDFLSSVLLTSFLAIGAWVLLVVKVAMLGSIL